MTTTTFNGSPIAIQVYIDLDESNSIDEGPACTELEQSIADIAALAGLLPAIGDAVMTEYDSGSAIITGRAFCPPRQQANGVMKVMFGLKYE